MFVSTLTCAKIGLMRKKSFHLILLATTTFICIVAALFFGGRFTASRQSVPLSDRNQILVLLKERIAESGETLFSKKVTSIKDIKVEGEWAITETTLVYRTTGESAIGEGEVDIYRKIDGKWAMAIPGTDIYKKWLDVIPATLIPAETKPYLR